MTFIRNTAETQGGAIFTLFPSNSNVLPVFNTRCFIQYKGNIELEPFQWDVSSLSIITVHRAFSCCTSFYNRHLLHSLTTLLGLLEQQYMPQALLDAPILPLM